MTTSSLYVTVSILTAALPCQQEAAGILIRPARSEVVEPLLMRSFDRDGETPERRQGGRPCPRGELLVFDGATDGNRQVDP